MDPRLSNRLYPTARPIGPAAKSTKPVSQQSPQVGFQHLLAKALGQQPLRFSKHAAERMQQRQIELSPTDMTRLQQAVTKAAQKGARDSLILLNRTAFLVNVQRRTVVTAVDEAHMRENVFTNIDSAVILD